MAVVFLIGGTGNQLFQYATSAPADRFSALFLRPGVCRLLGWTPHDRAFGFPAAPGWAVAGALLLLLLDLALARTLRLSLFTDFDNRLANCQPRLRRLLAFGYFQKRPRTRDTAWIRAEIAPPPPPILPIHIRGGDLRTADRMATHRYGVLPDSYYSRILQQAAADGALEGLTEAQVFTDDPAHARRIMEGLALPLPCRIEAGPLDEMLRRCLGAEVFVASNSTLAWWIVELRGPQASSYAPRPFHRGSPVRTQDWARTVRPYYPDPRRTPGLRAAPSRPPRPDT